MTNLIILTSTRITAEICAFKDENEKRTNRTVLNHIKSERMQGIGGAVFFLPSKPHFQLFQYILHFFPNNNFCNCNALNLC